MPSGMSMVLHTSGQFLLPSSVSNILKQVYPAVTDRYNRGQGEHIHPGLVAEP